MTDQTAFHGDPDGVLPKVEEVRDDVDKIYSLTINELTPEQFEYLSAGVTKALKQDPRNKTAKIAGKAALLATTMVFVAGCLWLVAFVVANLPTR